MTRRKQKRAFEKWWKFEKISHKEWRSVIDYCVEKFGSLSVPSMKREWAMMERYQKGMKPFLENVYDEWLKNMQGIGFKSTPIRVTWLNAPISSL